MRSLYPLVADAILVVQFACIVSVLGGQGCVVVGYWVGRVVYDDAPQWAFIVGYSVFGALVLATWIWIRSGKDRSDTSAGDEH